MIKKKITFQAIKYNKDVSNEAKSFFNEKNKHVEKKRKLVTSTISEEIKPVVEEIKVESISEDLEVEVKVEKKKRTRKSKK